MITVFDKPFYYRKRFMREIILFLSLFIFCLCIIPCVSATKDINVQIVDVFEHTILYYHNGSLIRTLTHGDTIILKDGDVLYLRETKIDIMKNPETAHKYAKNLYGFMLVSGVLSVLIIFSILAIYRKLQK